MSFTSKCFAVSLADIYYHNPALCTNFGCKEQPKRLSHLHHTARLKDWKGAAQVLEKTEDISDLSMAVNYYERVAGSEIQ